MDSLPAPVGHALCDRCGSSAGELKSVDVVLLQGSWLGRCDSCGLRTAERDGVRNPVSTCKPCGLPYPVSSDGESGRCGDCRDGLLPANLPADEVARAAEHEIVDAVSARFDFVELPGKSDYLTRVARALAPRIWFQQGRAAPLPSQVIVHVFRDDAARTLSLPSGLMFVSTGTLGSLRDEAELAFLLAHDLAHVAAGDASIGLIRIGLRTVAAIPEDGDVDAWTRAGRDLMCLGYGADHEHLADLAALRALVAAGYDPAAPLSYLGRLQELVNTGDAGVADLACAHPPARQRITRINDAFRTEFPAEGPGRTNREVFRRAAGARVLLSGLRPLTGGLGQRDSMMGPTSSRLPAVLTTLGIVLLACVILVLGFLFAR